jgi:hypothetical protein
VEAQEERPLMSSAGEIVRRATESIAAAGCDSPEADAKVLVAKALAVGVEDLDLDGDTAVSPEAQE